MKTLYKKQYWSILNLFYMNNNTQLHLRQISRLLNLREGALSRHLNYLLKENVLVSESIGNMKFFKVRETPRIFLLFDIARFDELPLLRRNAIQFYIEKLSVKPIFIIIFGSTAKGVFNDESDLDIVSVFDKVRDTKQAVRYAESQTGITISDIIISLEDFKRELNQKEDMLIQSALETGFVAYNHAYYYEVMRNARYSPEKNDERQEISSKKT
jgi:predicted nucleotidyltransferase